MTVGFYTVYRRDPQHLLHAEGLVADVQTVMPGTPIIQLTDQQTPRVDGVTDVRRSAHGPMLERRLEHYAACEGDWLLVDTDVSLVRDVREVFTDPVFDVALSDRHWPHLPQTADMLQQMPFNTGAVFSRSSAFWAAVLRIWRSFDDAGRREWYSEQKAACAAVRSGQFRVKILSGAIYNYPPEQAHDLPATVAIAHYKGPKRKAWLTERIYARWREQKCA